MSTVLPPAAALLLALLPLLLLLLLLHPAAAKAIAAKAAIAVVRLMMFLSFIEVVRLPRERTDRPGSGSWPGDSRGVRRFDAVPYGDDTAQGSRVPPAPGLGERRRRHLGRRFPSLAQSRPRPFGRPDRANQRRPQRPSPLTVVVRQQVCSDQAVLARRACQILISRVLSAGNEPINGTYTRWPRGAPATRSRASRANRPDGTLTRL
jgi:hypothetical protein